MDDPLGTVNESVRRRFEADWKAGTPGELTSYLPNETDRHYLATLVELVGIDLEMRWRKRALGGTLPPPASEYLSRFPVLNRSDLIDEFTKQEGELRRRAGESHTPSANGLSTSVVNPPPGPAMPAFARLPRIPDCEIVRELGHGGMGVVYLAKQTSLNRLVAVKTIRFAAASERDRERFLHEAEAVARLRHPNIVPIFHVGRDTDPPYFVMEYVEGGTLAGRLDGGPLPVAEAAAVVETLARAVESAHQCGVIHRDLKPANVLLSNSEFGIRNAESKSDSPTPSAFDSAFRIPHSTLFPKVTDFGLAKTIDADSHLTQTGHVLGTPSYMAPEQAAGQSSLISTRTDVYALGAILYECLTGRPPFKGDTVVATLDAVRSEEPVPPSRLRPDVSRDLETICLQCLRKAPAGRYASAGHLADDLHRYRTHRPVLARRVGPVGVAWRWARRNPGLAATLVMAAVAVAAVATVGFRNVVVERNKFKVERDRAEANLYRSLTAEAAGHVDARGPEWWWRATEGIATAAAMDVPQRNADELRDLYVRCLGTQYPSFRVTEVWGGPDAARPVRVAVSPVAGVAAVGRDGGTVELRQLPRGEVSRSTLTHAGEVTALVFSPWRSVAYSASDDGSVTATPFLRETAWSWANPTGAGVSTLVVSPDGSRLYAGTTAGEVWRFDVSGPVTPSAELFFTSPDGITGLTVSPDGQTVVVADEGKRTLGLNAGDAGERWQFKSVNPACELRFSRDGHHLAYVDLPSFGFAIYNVVAKATAAFYQIHERPLRRVVPMSRGFFTAAADGSVRVWGREASRPLFAEWARGRADFGIIEDADLSPDETRVVVAYRDGTVRVWEMFEPPVRQFRGGFSQSVSFVGPSATLFDGAGFFDAAGGATPRFVSNDGRHTDRVWCTASTADGAFVATGAHDKSVKLWDAAKGTCVATYDCGINFVWSVAIHPTLPKLAAAHGLITIWDTEHHVQTRTLGGHRGMTNAVAYHPTKNVLASLGRDRAVRLWDPDKGTMLGEYLFSTTYGHSLAFDDTGTKMAVGCEDGTVAVWDVPEGKLGEPTAVLKGHTTPVRAVAFAPTGELVSGAEQGIVLLRDPANAFKKLVQLQSGSGQIRSLQFSRDGRFLGCGVYVSPAVVWDLPAVRKGLAAAGLDW